MKNNQEFEQLLVAHANKELTREERRRLEDLVAEEPSRRDTLVGFHELHDLLDEERALAARVMTPSEPAEETDESYRRLCQAAARAEQQLRVKLLNPVHREGRKVPTIDDPAGGRRRLVLWLGAAAAAAVLVAILSLVWANRGPDLMGGAPGNKELGPRIPIVVEPALSQESRAVSWHDVAGARTYTARILDADNKVVLERPGSRQGSTEWQLTEEQYQALKAHEGPLYLQVVARDSARIPLASTGDLLLKIR